MMADIDMERLQQFGDAQITVGKWNALQAENDALRARIAELEGEVAQLVNSTKLQFAHVRSLEAPVLPDDVAIEISWHRTAAKLAIDPIERENRNRTADILTRLSTVTEEDVERVGKALASSLHDQLTSEARQETPRAAIAAFTARLKGEP